MKTLIRTLIISGIFIVLFGNNQSNAGYVFPSDAVYNDLWDVSRGIAADYAASSSHDVGYVVRDAFGATEGSAGQGQFIFQDFLGRAAVNSITWNTGSPVTLDAVQIWALAVWDNDRRYFSHVNFYVDGNLEKSQDVPVPYHGNINDPTPLGVQMDFSDAPIIGSNFRMDFTFDSDGYANAGPRILEIDGFGSPVPLPGAIWLLGSGLLGLAGWRFRKE